MRLQLLTLYIISCWLLLLAVGASAKRKSQRARSSASIQGRRRLCRKQQCANMPQFEDDNCVNKCISESCYNEVYAGEPLEPGEVDTKRWQAFSICTTAEIRTLAQLERAKRLEEMRNRLKEKE